MTPLEAAVMERLLAGPAEVFASLRSQFAVSTVLARRKTGVGFFLDFRVAEAAVPVPGSVDFEIGGVSAVIRGLKNGAGFVLFVRGGLLHGLEGYSFDEPWPAAANVFEINGTGQTERYKP